MYYTKLTIYYTKVIDEVEPGVYIKIMDFNPKRAQFRKTLLINGLIYCQTNRSNNYIKLFAFVLE